MRFRAVRTGQSIVASTTTNAFGISRDEAQKMVRMGHHRHQQSAFESVSTALGCSGANLLYPHFTSTPLSSASLMANYIRSRILRNLEHLSSAVIRRTLDIVTERHSIWQHSSSQEGRGLQCEQVKEHLEREEKLLSLKLEFDSHNAALKERLGFVREELDRVQIALRWMEDTVKGSLHPTSLQQGDSAFLTSTEVAQLPSPLSAIRGIWIRIKGPKRGTRCAVWEKFAGRISTNSVDFVTSEEETIGIPSKLGIFGLKVRIVYGKKDRLMNPRKPINCLDQPLMT